MKINFIKLLVVFCCFSIFSCNKETKETIIITEENSTIVENGDGLTEEDLVEWDKLEVVDVNVNNILLPNGSTIGVYKTSLGKSDAGQQENSNKIISKLCESAGAIITYKPNLYIGIPTQTKLVYVYGDKRGVKYQYREYKTRRQGLYCPESLYGLDCSALLYNIFREAGFTSMPYTYADAQRKLPFLENEFKRHNNTINYNGSTINFDNIVIKERGKLAGTSLATGDIIYWKSGNAAYHIGMIVVEQTTTGKRMMIAASNGSPKDCSGNLLPKRGPNFYEIQPTGSPLIGFSKNYSVIRISEKVPCNAKTISGGFGVTPTLHSVGSMSGTIQLNYEMYSIPDKLEVFYEGKLLFSTNGFVSGNKSESIVYEYNDSTKTEEIEVIVTGDNAGTAWEYTVNCPQK